MRSLAAVLLCLTAAAAGAAPVKEKTMDDFKKPSKEELRKKLTPEQFAVVCNDDTEPAFQNAYWDNHEPGIYVDIATGEPLFSSGDKFDSGTGWPSFTKPLDPEVVVEKTDTAYGMKRVEVRSKRGDSHLGHVFDDGPAPLRKRFCINSASLKFIPAGKLEAEGYGKYAALFKKNGAQATRHTAGGQAPGLRKEVIYLAGGCFWGMEEILRKIPGVLRTEVGYTGGSVDKATYENHEGHAEAVLVEYDADKLSFDNLLKWFYRMHDPTTLNRQGNDRGTSYRSAIFYLTEEQRKTAEAVTSKVNKLGDWGAPVVTQIVKAGPWWKAEGYHQDYLQKTPGGYTCHFLRPESVLGF